MKVRLINLKSKFRVEDLLTRGTINKDKNTTVEMRIELLKLIIKFSFEARLEVYTKRTITPPNKIRKIKKANQDV